VDVRIFSESAGRTEKRAATNEWILEVKNSGTADSASDKTIIDLKVPPGALQNLMPATAAGIETLCALGNNSTFSDRKTCSQRRANLIRFKPRALRVGQTVKVRLLIDFGLQTTVPILVHMQTDTGEQYENRLAVAIEGSTP